MTLGYYVFDAINSEWLDGDGAWGTYNQAELFRSEDAARDAASEADGKRLPVILADMGS